MTKRNRRKRLKLGTRDLAQPKASVTLAQPRWDQGATGLANLIGLVSEERGHYDPDKGKHFNPNNVRGVRRVDMLEVYAKRGWISKRGHTAGESLRNAWDATQKSKGTDLSDPRVDRTPKPGAFIDIQVNRVSKLAALSKLVAKADQSIVFAVACEGRSISHLPQYRNRNHEKGKVHLYEAFERLADAICG